MARDDDTTIQELKKLAEIFRDERNWKQFHTPKNLSMSLAVEAAELMEHFIWDRNEHDGQQNQEVIDELADIMINVLSFANVYGIDIAAATMKKIEKASAKYPTEIFHDDQQDIEKFKEIKKAYRQGKMEQHED